MYVRYVRKHFSWSKIFPIGWGITELVRNAFFSYGGTLTKGAEVAPKWFEKNFFLQTAITRELSDWTPKVGLKSKKKFIPTNREREGNEKNTIPIIRERKWETVILGKGREREFLLTPEGVGPLAMFMRPAMHKSWTNCGYYPSLRPSFLYY